MEALKKQVREFMTKDVISVNQNDDLKKVLALMDKHGILGLPVTDKQGKLIGMITETDLIKPLQELKSPFALTLLGSVVYLESLQKFDKQLKEHCAQTVKDLMTEEVVSVSEDVPLQEVLILMSQHGVNRLPVVDDTNHLVGIVTRSDIVHELAKQKKI